MLLGICFGTTLVLALTLVGRAVRSRQHAAAIETRFRGLRLNEIPWLARECERVFVERLESPLHPADPLEALSIIDDAIKSDRARLAFLRADLEWHFVVAVGAYLGELARDRMGGQWSLDPDGAPTLDLSATASVGPLRPFERVLEHYLEGTPGALQQWATSLLGTARDDHSAAAA